MCRRGKEGIQIILRLEVLMLIDRLGGGKERELLLRHVDPLKL